MVYLTHPIRYFTDVDYPRRGTSHHPLVPYVDDEGDVSMDVYCDYVCEAALAYTGDDQTYYLRIPDTKCPDPRMPRHDTKKYGLDPAETVTIVECAHCPRNIKGD